MKWENAQVRNVRFLKNLVYVPNKRSLEYVRESQGFAFKEYLPILETHASKPNIKVGITGEI